MKPYDLPPEHRETLATWRERWRKIASSCDGMSDADRAATRGALRELYATAGLIAPPDERIVFVSSPLVARCASGFAAGLWHLQEDLAAPTESDAERSSWNETRDATRHATRDALWTATLAAATETARETTWNALNDETAEAIWNATADATLDATLEASWQRVDDALKIAIWDATFAVTRELPMIATRASSPTTWFFDCARAAYRMLDSGGESVAFIEYLTFFRDVARLDKTHGIDYRAFTPYQVAAAHSGIRFMHPRFCIVSDRAAEVHIETVNGRGRLHNPKGPAKRYRDGWGIYAIHGIRVPAQVVESPETLTASQIANEPNVEVRRVMLDRFGAARFVREIGATMIDSHPLHGKLYRYDLSGDEPVCVLEVINASPEPIDYIPGENDIVRDGRVWKAYFLRVPPTCTNALEARAWTFDITPDDFRPMTES